MVRATETHYATRHLRVLSRPGRNGHSRGVTVEQLLALAEKLSDPKFFKYGGYTAAEQKELTDPYSQVAAVYACIEARARPIAGCPLKVYTVEANGERMEAESSPFDALLYRPNPSTSRYQFLHQWETNICRTGNVFVLLDRERENAIPAAMWVLKSSAVEPIRDDRGLLKAWKYKGVKGEKTYEPFQVLHDKLPNPDDPILGKSPLDAADLDIRQEWDVTRWNRSFLANSCDPGGRYEMEGGAPIAQDQARSLLRYHENANQGPNATGRALIEMGGIKWKGNAIPHKDMSFEQQRDFNLRAIKMVLGVPSVALGMEEDIPYAGAKAQMRMFWTNTLIPRVRMVEDVLWASLTHSVEDGRYELLFDLQAVEALADDLNDRVGVIPALFNVGVPLSEINRRLDLGLEEHDGWDTPYLPGSYLPAGEEGPAPSPAPAGGTAPVKSGKDAVQLVDYTPAEIKAARTWHSRVVQPNVKRFHGKMRSFFFEHRRETLERFAQETGWSGAEKAAGDEPKKPAHVDIEAVLPPAGAMKKRMVEMVEPIYRSSLLDAAKFTADSLGTEVQVAEIRREMARWLKEEGLDKITQIEDTVREGLRESLEEGVKAGETTYELAGRIKHVHQNAQGRAMTIARTEVGRAANKGMVAESEESGVVKGYKWNAAMDGATRPTHRAAHGQYQDLGELFSVGGAKLAYPLDPSGPAEETINCRCGLSPVTKDDDEIVVPLLD